MAVKEALALALGFAASELPRAVGCALKFVAWCHEVSACYPISARYFTRAGSR